MKNKSNKTSELTLTQLTEIETKGQQLLALVGDLDPNDERRIIFKSRFEDLLRPYKEELRQKTDKTFSSFMRKIFIYLSKILWSLRIRMFFTCAEKFQYLRFSLNLTT